VSDDMTEAVEKETRTGWNSYCILDEGCQSYGYNQPSTELTKVHGRVSLNHSQPYYYQVQTQIFVCDNDYYDFCVCTFSGDEESKIHIERIFKNNVL